VGRGGSSAPPVDTSSAGPHDTAAHGTNRAAVGRLLRARLRVETLKVDREFSVAGVFPPVAREQWEALADSEAGGPFDERRWARADDGAPLRPLATAEDWPSADDPCGFPGFPPYLRGSRPLGKVAGGWEILQEHAHPSASATAAAIAEDLEGGATSIALRWDAAGRAGLDPDDPQAMAPSGADGLIIGSVEDLEAALAPAPLEHVGVHLRPGGAFLPAAALLAAVWSRRGVEPARARGCLGADPLGTLASGGRLPASLAGAFDQLAELVGWARGLGPGLRAVEVSTLPYHEAGASAAEELGLALATGVAYLRGLGERGVDVETAGRRLLMTLGLGCEVFQDVAKLRAARQLWWRVMKACDASPSASVLVLQARLSRRALTARDPWINVVRGTTAGLAAAIGGAEVVEILPFDAAIGLPDGIARRLARNVQLILREEAHLGDVIDPAGGAWSLETLTERTAEAAWGIFRAIEGQGGLPAALKSGWVAERLSAAWARQEAELRTRRRSVTGVSDFPDLAEEPLRRAPPDRAELIRAVGTRVAEARERFEVQAALAACEAMLRKDNSRPTSLMSALIRAASTGAPLGAMAALLAAGSKPETIAPLPLRRWAEPFERLREAADRFAEATGARPAAALIGLGTQAHGAQRLDFARHLMAAGGIESVPLGWFAEPEAAARAYADSGSALVVLDGLERADDPLAEQALALLKPLGPRRIALVLDPGAEAEAWRRLGVGAFLYPGGDALEVLARLGRDLGVE